MSLSDKYIRENVIKMGLDINHEAVTKKENWLGGGYIEFYYKKDVKKFIKELKEELHDNLASWEIEEIIEELAGEDLV